MVGKLKTDLALPVRLGPGVPLQPVPRPELPLDCRPLRADGGAGLPRRQLLLPRLLAGTGLEAGRRLLRRGLVSRQP